MRKLLLALLGLSLFIGWGLPVRAQGEARADLYPADTSAFPTVSAFLDVFDETGRFVSGLKSENIVALEDGQQLAVQELNEMVVPAQIVVAINPGPSLGIRDSQGTPRFQKITQALSAWAMGLPPSVPDDMSLVTIAGPVIAHASAKDWMVSLNAFQPDFHATTPNLQSLSNAIDTASAPTPRAGMKRAVLFITPHMDDPNIDTLIQPLIKRAIQNRVRVFVWFVDTDLYTATTSAAAFNDLALQTGGMYFAASGSQTLPDPEAYFAPLRRLYSLKYTSAIKAGGTHTLAVEVKIPTGAVKSEDQPFNVDIQPPNPILVTPPTQIVRRPPEDDPYNENVLLPSTQQINIIVEFPDGHQRPLVSTTLYVDGQVVAENKAAPFNTFTWDLSGYKVSGEHKIVVEAMDSLGLSKTSMEMPITVTVIQPPHGVAAFFARDNQYITIAAVAFAGFVLLLILFLGRMRTSLAGARSRREAQADPLTQAVVASVEAPVKEKVRNRRGRPSASEVRTKRVEARAFLRRLNADLQPLPASPISLTQKEITLGSDPVQSMHVLDDPSLSARHARITQTEDGGFLVADAGSVAGTWVNFEPVGKEGRLLQHGDVVHFGQLAFRFELKDPPSEAEPRITKENPSS